MTHALALPIPSTVGNIDAYIQAASRYPMLSEAEEIRLAERFHNDGDVEAARQLVLSHLRLVISIARGYLGYGLPHADLIQEGNIGLMKAVKRYDPTRGVRLVSFAMHWIKAEIHEYILKNWRLVKVATTKAQRKLFFNLRSLKNDYEGVDTLSGTQAAELKKDSQAGKLTTEKIEQTVAPTKREMSPPLKVTFSEDELRAYFPKKDTTVGDVKRVVFEALDLRQKALDRQKARAEQEKAAKKAAPGKAR